MTRVEEVELGIDGVMRLGSLRTEIEQHNRVLNPQKPEMCVCCYLK